MNVKRPPPSAMRLMKVNLLSKEKAATGSANAGTSPVKFFISPLVVVLVFAASFAFGRISLSDTASAALAPLSGLPIIGQMSHLVGSPDRKLIGETADRINILLIGMGGEGHDGPNLTDTLMVASIRPSDHSVALLSVPRDLLVPIQGEGWRKINAVNAYAEVSDPGSGGDHVRTAMEGVLGIDIPYYIRVDFTGFKDVIDSVGGVDVYVERSFTDTTYPTYNHGIKTISFKKGWLHMDGETALEYARSRHGNNGEGSDFARARRQQKVLAALKDKLLSMKTFTNPAAITNALASLKSNITTNLHLGDIIRLATMAKSIDTKNIKHEVLDNSPNGPLVDSVVGGAYVLLPRNNDWRKLRDIAANIFTVAQPVPANEAVPPAPATATAAAEKATVEIQNGNGTSGVARDMATQLQQLGFEVVKIGNADNFSYGSTVVYDLTDGKMQSSRDRIAAALGNAKVENARQAKVHDPSADADFLVIIGKK